MSDTPELSKIVNDFKPLRWGGDLAKAARHIDASLSTCNAENEPQCRNEFFEELNKTLHEKYKDNGALGMMLDNFDLVDATNTSLVFKPRVPGADGALRLIADRLGSDSPLSFGNPKHYGEFWVDDHKLHSSETDVLRHTQIQKVGAHAVAFDTNKIESITLHPEKERITDIVKTDGTRRHFHYDLHGHLDYWTYSDGERNTQYWQKGDGDAWHLYDTGSPVYSPTFPDFQPGAAKPIYTWYGTMKLDGGGNLIQQERGKEQTIEPLESDNLKAKMSVDTKPKSPAAAQPPA